MKQSSKRIAITGGIGSGKSSVAKIIAAEGYPVFSCDEIYSGLLNNGDFLAEIENSFKGTVKGGKLDRAKLSAEVFGDKKKLEKLNSITHKRIIEAAFLKTERERLGFIEVPLLFENGYEKLFDGTIVVLRDLKKRIQSVMLRDKITEREVISRINGQFNYDNCDFAKYYVIHNNSNLDDLRKNTLKILDEVEANMQ